MSLVQYSVKGYDQLWELPYAGIGKNFDPNSCYSRELLAEQCAKHWQYHERRYSWSESEEEFTIIYDGHIVWKFMIECIPEPTYSVTDISFGEE